MNKVEPNGMYRGILPMQTFSEFPQYLKSLGHKVGRCESSDLVYDLQSNEDVSSEDRLEFGRTGRKACEVMDFEIKDSELTEEQKQEIHDRFKGPGNIAFY